MLRGVLQAGTAEGKLWGRPWICWRAYISYLSFYALLAVFTRAKISDHEWEESGIKIMPGKSIKQSKLYIAGTK